MKSAISFLMRNNFLKFTWFIFAMLSLSSCLYMMGDKFAEKIDCPVKEGRHVIDFQYGSCTTPTIFLPKSYVPKCETPWPLMSGEPIQDTSFFISYPDFLPVQNGDINNMKKGEIYVSLSSACITGRNNKPLPERYSSYIKKNEIYSDDPFGKKQFAPIKYLGNGMYLQKNIREPYAAGNSSIYFYKDENGKIPFMFSCNGVGRCESDGITEDEDYYHYRYFFYGIDYDQFYKLDQGMKKFLNELKLKPSAP